ncbi:MAG: amino acid--tRNA ligase-related protein, partial [Planctomycetota bacterium]
MPSASLIRDRIALRARVTRATRAFFDERGFHEVTTPVLSPQLIVDAHIDPFETVMYPDPRRPQEGPRWYLRTSPEAHMKRLVAAGAEALYQLAPVFRAGEHGPLHNPEFTMLEWYRLDDRLADAIRFT